MSRTFRKFITTPSKSVPESYNVRWKIIDQRVAKGEQVNYKDYFYRTWKRDRMWAKVVKRDKIIKDLELTNRLQCEQE